MKSEFFNNLKENISKEKQIATELEIMFNQLEKIKNTQEKEFVLNHINSLKNSLIKENKEFTENLEKVGVAKKLNPTPQKKLLIQKQIKIVPETPIKTAKRNVKILTKTKKKNFSELENETIKRLRQKEKKVVGTKEKKASSYVKLANKWFSNKSKEIIKKGTFRDVERSLIRAKTPYIPSSYISVMILTVVVSAIISVFLFIFFLFFTITTKLPIINFVTDGIGLRFFKLIWILFVFPILTGIFMYFYPSLEEKATEMRINTELPFATIHMAAIAGSMIEPSKIFTIIIQTKEYPYLEREFIKLLNEINIYGYDLITALKNVSFNSPSKKFAELLNGLSTTIGSGGDLPNFFKKRSETLLFEYKINREKQIKTSETFMDVYISVVIATPMILMLLLIMMKISGLGFSMSTSTITLITVLGVFLINVFFLTFLHLKQPIE